MSRLPIPAKPGSPRGGMDWNLIPEIFYDPEAILA
jgi:hypothetical protein